jgi:addiction module RelE/StbE family toxin
MIKSKRIEYSKKFDKQLKKAPLEIKIAFRNRLSLFLKNKFNSALKNHTLTGNFKGYRSINITGDWRAIYSENFGKTGEGKIIFELLGTHSQLYK